MYSEFFLTMRTLPCCARVPLGKESQSKMLIKMHLSQSKTAHNLVMRIGTIKSFGGIQTGARPNNNQRKCLLMPESKCGITGFFIHLHYSIYKPSQVEGALL